jgi:hypothetical protein
MSPRVRIIGVATLLVVFFGFGAGWLVTRATSTTSRPPVAPSAGHSDAPPVTTEPGTSQPGAPSPGSASSTSSSPKNMSSAGGNPPGGNPPKPTRSVEIAGPRLDGSEEKNGCGRLLLHQDEPTVGLPVHIDAITLAITPPTARPIHDDEAGCGSLSDPDAPLCADATFGPGGADSCLVGVRLEPDPAPDADYSVTVGLRLRVHCTSPDPYPCSTIGDPVPTVSEPVDATWSRTGPELVVEGNPNPQDGDEETPAEDEEQPAEDEEQPAEDEEQPAGDEEQPAGDEEQPAGDEEQPAGDEAGKGHAAGERSP